ncbi:MAG: TolC family protein [Muribaculaceae bacterium]|nr:TolC family protein [Muribaculaceae bacterium]
MNIKPVITAAFSAAFFIAAAAPSDAVPAFSSDSLTLDDCLRIAMTNSPTVKVADKEVERVDYSRKEVIGQLLPNIDFSASYSRMLAKQVMYMNMDAFKGMGGGAEGGEGGEDKPAEETPGLGKSDGGIKVGLDNSYNMGFQASMPLIAPQLWASLSLTKEQVVRNVEAARQSRQQLVNQVKSAYYGLLLAEDSRRVIQESYDMAALTHDTYVKQQALGAASDYDVLRTSVAMKNIEPQLTQANIAIRRARLNLLILMGLDSSFELKPADRLSNYESDMYGAALEASNTDYSGNADLKLLDIDTKLTARSLKLQKLAYAPTLALTANYTWTSMNNGTPFKSLKWNPYSMLGVSLQIPIFSGGQRYSKVKQAQIQLEELRLQRENLERSIASQVALAADNIRLNVEQIASSSESVRQAETAHTIMEKSFNIGAASYLNLRDSELALTQARLAYYQAIYNYLIARSELELLQGNAPIEKYSSANN